MSSVISALITGPIFCLFLLRLPLWRISLVEALTAQVSHSQRHLTDYELVFPEPSSRTKKDKMGSLILDPMRDLALCKSKNNSATFCEELNNYPKTLIKNLLAKNESKYRIFYSQDLMFNNVTNRIGDQIRAKELCSSDQKQVFPKAAENKDEIWKYIVNVDDKIQGIVVEMCPEDKKDAPCNFHQVFPLGHRTKCVQKYIYRKLLAVNQEGTDVEIDTFRIPSCCTCIVELIGK